MTNRKRAQFGRIDEELNSRRIYPYACMLLLFAAWCRFPARDLIGFKLGESILLSGVALAFLIVFSRPSIVGFIYGVSLWVWGLLIFAESAFWLHQGNFRFLEPSIVVQFPPNAAVIISALGLGLSIVSKRRRRSFQSSLSLVLSTIALAVSGAAIWGHTSGVVGAYSWGRFEALSFSGSVLYFISAILLFIVARTTGSLEERPSSRSTIVSLGLGGAVAATLVIAASMADIDNRRVVVLSSELTSLRRAIHVQQEVLVKAMRKLGAALTERSGGSEVGSQEIMRELRYIRAIGKVTAVTKDLVAYPPGIEIDRDVILALAEDLRAGGRTIESKVLRKGETWRICVVIPTSGQEVSTFAIIDVRELFFDLLSNIPDQMNVTISYLSQEVAFQGDRSQKHLEQTTRNEVHELVFTFLGWPGWCVSIAPGVRFDEVHALSGVFKVPFMLLITLSAMAWAWGVQERARRGKRLVDDIKTSAVFLQKENIRWASALEDVSDGVLICDTNEKIEFYNKSARRIFGKILERKGPFIGDVLTTESSVMVRTIALPEVKISGTWEGTITILAREGQTRQVPVKVVPTHGAHDGLLGFVFIINEVVRGKQAPQAQGVAQGTEEERLYEILDGLEVPTWLAGGDGTIRYGNKRLLDFLGVSFDHFQRGWPLEFCHRDDVTGFVAAGARLGTHRRRIQNSTGFTRWFTESITAIRNSRGEVRNYIGALVECGKELKFEEGARCLREELSILLNVESSVWWIHDLSRRKVTYVSGGFEQLWGISSDELLLQPSAWESLSRPQVVVPEVVTEQGVELEYAIVRDDGINIPVVHKVYSAGWSDGVDSEKHIVHIVERRAEDRQRVTAPSASVRELKVELDHLYLFLAKNVHDAAFQVGTLGRTLGEQAKVRGDSEISNEAMQLQFESERLLAWSGEYGDIAAIISQQVATQEASIIEALERLSQNRVVVPQHISFSGDLGVKLPLPVEMLELGMRALAVFVADRRGNRIPADIKIMVKRAERGMVVDCALGELPLSNEQLWQSFLPGAFTHSKGRAAPSLATINAIARRRNGRAWLSNAGSGRVVLHIHLRSE